MKWLDTLVGDTLPVVSVAVTHVIEATAAVAQRVGDALHAVAAALLAL